MRNAIYGNRYYSQSSTAKESRQYLEPAELNIKQSAAENSIAIQGESQVAQSQGTTLTQSQQVLTTRYEETRNKIVATLHEFEAQMDGVKTSDAATQEKLGALDEIESILTELGSKEALYHALESNLLREGLQTDSDDLGEIIDQYQKNIDEYQGSLIREKNQEEAEIARKEKEAEEAKQAAEAEKARAAKEKKLNETEAAAREKMLQDKKEQASQAIKELTGYLNGGLKPNYKGDDGANAGQAEAILNIIANALKSGNWDPLDKQIEQIEQVKRGESLALVIALLKNYAPQSVTELVPPEIFYKLAEGIQSSDDQEKYHTYVQKEKYNKALESIGFDDKYKNTGITLAGYAAIAIELAGISEAYVEPPLRIHSVPETEPPQKKQKPKKVATARTTSSTRSYQPQGRTKPMNS